MPDGLREGPRQDPEPTAGSTANGPAVPKRVRGRPFTGRDDPRNRTAVEAARAAEKPPVAAGEGDGERTLLERMAAVIESYTDAELKHLARDDFATFGKIMLFLEKRAGAANLAGGVSAADPGPDEGLERAEAAAEAYLAERKRQRGEERARGGR
jgi:hypothetical protein